MQELLPVNKRQKTPLAVKYYVKDYVCFASAFIL